MPDIRPMNIGIIGCGDIARKAYVPACRKFSFLNVVACADVDAARGEAFAREMGIPRGGTVEALLADPAIELVVNLTVPKAHVDVDLRSLEAGKHVYSEKPFALSRQDGGRVLALAAAKGLRVGCAPDTVLGSGVQSSRHYIDNGTIGRVIGGSCAFLANGPEGWHPNPAFFYEHGAGPAWDMGPYYLHTLITLLGPVRRVCGTASMGFAQRVIGSLPKRGTVINVEVPTHVIGLLEFHCGAVVSVTLSFDMVAGTNDLGIDLYGTEGAIRVPDPNYTDGPVRIARRGLHDWTEYQRTHPYKEGSRGVGVADMALSIRANRQHRADERMAMHAVDILHAIHEAAASGSYVTLTTTCERPAAMRADLPDWNLG